MNNYIITDYWWTALGLGLVVSVAALTLLQMLLEQVQRVERASETVLEVATQVAANTQATSNLVDTSKRLDVLAEEAVRHDQFLREVATSQGRS